MEYLPIRVVLDEYPVKVGPHSVVEAMLVK